MIILRSTNCFAAIAEADHGMCQRVRILFWWIVATARNKNDSAVMRWSTAVKTSGRRISTKVKVLGIDLGKAVFHLIGMDEHLLSPLDYESLGTKLPISLDNWVDSSIGMR